jgi:protein-tyrosine phosphatase
VIDLHCHVLPGIDDGPRTIEGSLALARAAVKAGIRTVVATPHVSIRYPNDEQIIARLVGELNGRLIAEGVPLEIRAGAEIAITSIVDIKPEALARLGLGGGPWLLVEPPLSTVSAGLHPILLDLQQQGHQILLAHPERCPAFHREPEVLESLIGGGVLTSITAGSLAGKFGAVVRRFALQLARDGMIHNVSSDAHDHIRRAPGIYGELEGAGLAPLAEWLTDSMPAAILAGDELPARPYDAVIAEGRSRRSWWRRPWR